MMDEGWGFWLWCATCGVGYKRGELGPDDPHPITCPECGTVDAVLWRGNGDCECETCKTIGRRVGGNGDKDGGGV